MTIFTPEQQRKYHQERAGAAVSSKFVLLIEGRYLTNKQIAKELDMTVFQVAHRLVREQKKPGPVTMAGLAGK